MNILPVIIKSNNKRLLRMVDISDINTRSIDTPSFVESCNNTEFYLVFPGSSEQQSDFSLHGLSISIGDTSGRIYHISGLTSILQEQIIESITNSVGEGKSLRYKTNIKYSLHLINALYVKA